MLHCSTSEYDDLDLHDQLGGIDRLLLHDSPPSSDEESYDGSRSSSPFSLDWSARASTPDRTSDGDHFPTTPDGQPSSGEGKRDGASVRSRKVSPDSWYHTDGPASVDSDLIVHCLQPEGYLASPRPWLGDLLFEDWELERSEEEMDGSDDEMEGNEDEMYWNGEEEAPVSHSVIRSITLVALGSC